MPSNSKHDDDPFVLTAPLEIRSILRSMQRHAALVRMYVKGNSDQSIMTTVLAFDQANGRVIVDCSPDSELNQRLLRAETVMFETQLDRISVSFAAHNLQACTHDGLPAISFPLPESVRRVQRREFYRVEIPLNEPASCTIPITSPQGGAMRAVIKLKDISAGGVALLDNENLLPHEPGMQFRDARLTLPEVGEVTVDLDVLRVHTIELPNKKEIVELGCKFVNLSNASMMLIQSYIGQLERRLNAKRRGF